MRVHRYSDTVDILPEAFAAAPDLLLKPLYLPATSLMLHDSKQWKVWPHDLPCYPTKTAFLTHTDARNRKPHPYSSWNM